jgi:signal peptidase I
VLRETAETVLLAVIVFLVLNTVTARFRVHGLSMEPTLHDGQYLLISKVGYWFSDPQRGDVMVFHPPNRPGEDYIKRIVGLPGEQISIEGGRILVDGVPIDEPYIASPSRYSGVWDLGEGEYFVLGDNRANSSDSHTWGILPRQNMVGKAWVSYWPPESWGLPSHHTFDEDIGPGE